MMNEKLNIYSKNYTSQHGEDGILEYIISKITNIPKVCVEFGAWDGKFLSNTYTLWHEKKWSGILIEGDNKKVELLKKKYTADYDVTVFKQFISIKGKDSIDTLFKKNNINPEIGIISIDIDSYDYHVWKNMSFVNPYVVVIEHNYSIPGYVEYFDPEDEVFLRCSAKSLEKLGEEKGYKLICCTLTNSIFIRKDLFNSNYFPDKPVEYLFDYSGCSTPILEAYQIPVNNYIPVYFGIPSRYLRIALLVNNFFKSLFLKNKTLKKPPRIIYQQCKRNGVYVETLRRKVNKIKQ